ncbi:type II toxin-antitoxin system VapC family toxin [Corynebacterium sp. 22_2729]
MNYLLDTNVVSELRKPPGKVNPRVFEWVNAQILHSQYLSVITIYELKLGISRKNHTDPVQGQRLQKWFTQDLLLLFEGRVLPLDERVAIEAANMNVPDPRPQADLFIAATARVHGLTIVTRNQKDFEPMGVQYLNPWEV